MSSASPLPELDDGDGDGDGFKAGFSDFESTGGGPGASASDSAYSDAEQLLTTGDGRPRESR